MTSATSGEGGEGLSARARFVGTFAAWVGFYFASPGNSGREGSLALCVIACALFGLVLGTPPGTGTAQARRARAFEFLGHALGAALWFRWMGYVSPLALVYSGPVWGTHFFLMGVFLRRLLRRFPMELALPMAFSAMEIVRAALPTPIGMGWLRVGHHLHDHLWIAGSARVFGIEGLSVLVALFGGTFAALGLWAMRRARGESEPFPWLGPALSAAGLAVAASTAALVSAPETRVGPRVLLIQPAIPQDRRRNSGSARENFLSSRDLTRKELAKRDASSIDLVAWGESMLFVRLMEDGLAEAVEAGARPPAWWPEPLDVAAVRQWEEVERFYVQEELFAEAGLAPGTWFLGGANLFAAREGRVGFQVAVALYDGQGERRDLALKRHLASGAETIHGLELLPPVRALFLSLAGYVPDLWAAEETSVLTIEDREGRDYRFGASICFDNAFLGPFLQVTDGPLDFHLVASNEAWYRESHELDQMVAFSRLAALTTGRAVVRATNSGVSIALGPDGREIGRVEVDGQDRSVPGALLVDVPVPEDRNAFPPYRRISLLWRFLGVLLPAGAWFLGCRGNRSGVPG